MGDRANIIVKENCHSNGVVLYTHLNGAEMHKVLKKVLTDCCDRWDDAQYLAGAIYKEIIKTNDSLGYVGADGISDSIWDNDYPIFVLFCEDLELQVMSANDDIICEITFEDFIDKALSEFFDFEAYGFQR